MFNYYTTMKLKKELILRHIGREYVIVDPGQDTVDMASVYTLNEVAAWLWQQLEGEDFTHLDMVDLLMSRYDVERQQAEKDVEKLVKGLVQKGLIEE